MQQHIHKTQESENGIMPSHHGSLNRPVRQLKDNRPQSVHRNIIQKKANNTGLPDQLKAGIENLSGHSMDDVKVHYHSARPAQLNAHAYAQGTDIHIAAGQEKHLPHEAWHVVQQKEGRVKPTMQMKGKVNINDDAGLEKEADIMGARAMNTPQASMDDSNKKEAIQYAKKEVHGNIVQRVVFAKGNHVVVHLGGPIRFNAIVTEQVIIDERVSSYIVQALDGSLAGQRVHADRSQVSSFGVGDILEHRRPTRALGGGAAAAHVSHVQVASADEHGIAVRHLMGGPAIGAKTSAYVGGHYRMVLPHHPSRSNKSYMSGQFEREIAYSAEQDKLGLFSRPIPREVERPLPSGYFFYRGDSRVPSAVFTGGFSPRGNEDGHTLPPSFKPGTADVDLDTAVSGSVNPRVAGLFPLPSFGAWEPATYLYVCLPETIFHTYKIQREIAKGIRRGWLDRSNEDHVNLAMRASNLATANEVTARSIDGRVILGAFPVTRAQNATATGVNDWRAGYAYTVGSFVANPAAARALTPSQIAAIRGQIGGRSPVFNGISRYTPQYIMGERGARKHQDHLSRMRG